jgi:hypothetical protein
MLKRFVLHAGGAVAPLFAIAAIPMFCAVGAAVDFSRAYQERTVVQDALDAAALSGGKKIGGATNDEIKVEVEKYYYSNIGNKIENPPPLAMTVVGGTVTLNTTLHVPTFFLRVVGLDEIVFNMATAAKAGMGTIEVMLALDNSGSMSGSKITTLRDAATELTNKLYALAVTSTQPDPVKMGVVPFAASVNVGPQYANASWMDTGSQNPYHADALKCYAAGGTLNSSGVCSVSVGTSINNFTLFSGLQNSSGNPIAWDGCVEERPEPYDADDTPAYTGGGPTLEQRKTKFVPLFAPDEPDNWTCSTSGSAFCPNSGSSSSNRRYNGAPSGGRSYNNYLPDSGDFATCPSAFPSFTASASTDVITSSGHGLSNTNQIVLQTSGTIPGGLTAGTTYYVRDVTTNTFKVATSSGGSAVNITSGGSGTHRFTQPANWTCQSGNANCGGSGNGKSEASGFAGLNISGSAQCKYGTPANKATVANVSVGGIPAGPNFMCTTPPLQPLTTDKNLVLAKINQMQAQGATNILSGAAWGWRLLSEGEPFTEGRPYDATDNTKFLILMTDGANTYYPQSSRDILKSWYGAFGYVAAGHLGTTSTNSNTLADQMNVRTIQACANMKAAGVVIFTVGFDLAGEGPAAQARALEVINQCASDADKVYTPNSNGDLMNAFTAIGDAITSLRVSM